MATKPETPAFARATDNTNLTGLTKREYFAIRAFQGILSRQGSHGATSDARTAVEFADALTQALDAEATASTKSETGGRSERLGERTEFVGTSKL